MQRIRISLKTLTKYSVILYSAIQVTKCFHSDLERSKDERFVCQLTAGSELCQARPSLPTIPFSHVDTAQSKKHRQPKIKYTNKEFIKNLNTFSQATTELNMAPI